MSHQPPAFHKNAVLFGHDPTPRLLAFELEGDDRIRVFARTPDGRLESQTYPFRPFVLLASTELLSGWTGGFDKLAAQLAARQLRDSDQTYRHGRA